MSIKEVGQFYFIFHNYPEAPFFHFCFRNVYFMGHKCALLVTELPQCQDGSQRLPLYLTFTISVKSFVFHEGSEDNHIEE